ncbi:hypothetical protein VitviT2T_018838 [Vitis vinifera]|uniref:DUF4283 domain-containing protein n=1 Tax=Vitis vinifera TaxID=29760 RepID=A0ABY9D1Q8_VITVI|nr:hypothetical protein VitviT2T_018838 [Vitis vinifera]
MLVRLGAWNPSLFEISVDVFGNKLKGIIVERSRGFTSWIRFGSSSLCWLSEGVEANCRGEFGQRFVKSWEDGGRRFKQECRANEAGGFLLCLVVDLDAKRHCLVFPEGKAFLEGWALMAKKLRSLGISTCDEPREVFESSKTESRDGDSKEKKEKSYVDAVNTRGVSRVRRLGEAAWLQLGEEDVSRGRELLDRCLVGRRGETLVSIPHLCDLESWGKSHWKLKGGVKFVRMGGPFILIAFENKT